MFIAGLVILSLASVDGPSVTERLEDLKRNREGGQAPRAIVVVGSDTEGATSFSAFEIQTENQSSESRWRVKMVVEDDQRHTAYIADSDDCPAVGVRVAALERLPMPRVELFPRPASSQPRPVMGPLHRQAVFWSRGWSAEDEPLELTFTALGSSPYARWAEDTERALSRCWKGPSDTIGQESQ